MSSIDSTVFRFQFSGYCNFRDSQFPKILTSLGGMTERYSTKILSAIVHHREFAICVWRASIKIFANVCMYRCIDVSMLACSGIQTQIQDLNTEIHIKISAHNWISGQLSNLRLFFSGTPRNRNNWTTLSS